MRCQAEKLHKPVELTAQDSLCQSTSNSSQVGIPIPDQDPQSEQSQRKLSLTASSPDGDGQLSLAYSTAWSDSLSGLLSTDSSLTRSSAEQLNAFDDDKQDGQSLVFIADQSPDMWLDPTFSASSFDDLNFPGLAKSGFFPFAQGSNLQQPESPLRRSWLSASTPVPKTHSDAALLDLEIPESLVEEL